MVPELLINLTSRKLKKIIKKYYFFIHFKAPSFNTTITTQTITDLNPFDIYIYLSYKIIFILRN